ncbi:hypothetical protein [Picrophilus oshimae]|uniref:Uncharacterized protein n=1 Tax=Picrophilus torridus (strain ATCC 700027 / DSM 9790 / JCM 10055 / NBRC 100828 / KAW 2/3) TaxID=1122961 RepID=Q6L2S7_PICTO|nr:hypothetical protein [Picrophilus oshimae]AAT42725.1 hypothetical protein PTO0140 [Picrophilus oshimae DSM 9789]
MQYKSIGIEYPKRIRIKNKLYDIDLESARDENTFSIVIPKDYVKKFVIKLIEYDFKDALPSIYKGEIFGLSRPIESPWELHIRIFNHDDKYSKIFAHIEISRNYIEHLFMVQPVIYEVTSYIDSPYYILYEPESKKVSRIIENRKILLSPPENLMEWRPYMDIAYNEINELKYNFRGIIKKIDEFLHDYSD